MSLIHEIFKKMIKGPSRLTDKHFKRVDAEKGQKGGESKSRKDREFALNQAKELATPFGKKCQKRTS